MKPRLHPHLHRQRGAALLTAMIIVTLVSTLAAGMVWQQYRAVQVEGAERARAQSALLLQGALDFARIILREDMRTSPNVDSPGDQWAVPLAEARLSTFLAADREAGSTDDGPEAFLSGSIEDAQSHYNLRNLIDGSSSPAKVNPLELRALQRICDNAGVPTDTAGKLADALLLATGPHADGQHPPLAPQNVDQLAWLGLSEDNLRRLRPLVILLPRQTPLNLNTAKREVLATVFENMDLSSAELLVRARDAKPFADLAAVTKLLPGITFDASRSSVNSSYFLVSSRLRLEERLLEERSLVERRPGLKIVAVARERLNLLSPSK